MAQNKIKIGILIIPDGYNKWYEHESKTAKAMYTHVKDNYYIYELIVDYYDYEKEIEAFAEQAARITAMDSSEYKTQFSLVAYTMKNGMVAQVTTIKDIKY